MNLVVAVDAARAVERLEGLSRRVRDGIARVVEADTRKLLALVEVKVSGEVLHVRSGELLGSIRETGLKTDNAAFADSVVAQSPVTRIQEYGGRIEIPEIVPKRAKSLAFEYGGRLVFAMHASAHAVTIPERSFMRSTLAESAGAFVADIRKVTRGAIA